MALKDKTKLHIRYSLVNPDAAEDLINSVEQRSDADIAADAELFAAIQNEQAARIASDATIHNKINAEAAARSNSLATESEARRAADDELEERLDVVQGSDAVAGSIANSLKNAKAYTDSSVSTESARAINAEASLSAKINNMASNVDPAALDSLSEIVSAFQDADLNLNSAITTLANNGTANLNAEKTARMAADALLSGRLDVLEGSDTVTGSVAKALKDAKAHTDAEKAERIAADSAEKNSRMAAIDAEAAARELADNIEKSERVAADSAERASRTAAISAEAQSRRDADGLLQASIVNAELSLAESLNNQKNTLEASIDNEVSARTQADANLSSSLSSEVSRAQSAESSLSNALFAEVARAQAAEVALQSSLDAEISTRQISNADMSALLGAEQAARQNADAILQANISSEQVARIAADNQLQNAINIESTARKAEIAEETSARVANDINLQNMIALEGTQRAEADSAIQNSLALESASRQNSDNTIQNNLNAEIVLRQSALATEAAARQSADLALQGNLDAEKTARENADNSLQVSINNEVLARQSAVAAEAAARQAADAALQASINNVLSNLDTGALDSLSEIVAAFQDADSNLQGAISSLAVNSSSKVDDEATARIAADNSLAAAIELEAQERDEAYQSLQNQMDSEISTRQDEIDAEITARQNADLSLEAAIAAEQSSRVSGDNFLQIQVDELADYFKTQQQASSISSTNALNAEASLRQSSDEALQAAIDSEAARALAAESALAVRIDNVLSNIDPDALDSLAEAVTAFQAADSEIQAAISNLASSGAAGLNEEQSARAAGDAALEASLSAEAAARELEDANIRSALSAEIAVREASNFAEMSRAIAAEVAVQENLNAEVLRAVGAEAALQVALSDEASSRVAAVTEAQDSINIEKTARMAADTQLQEKIDVEVSNRIAADNSESAARLAADNDLSNRIDILEGSDAIVGSVAKALKDAKAHTDAEVSTEQQRAMTAEAALAARVDAVLSNIDPDALDSLSEIVTAFQAADANIQGTISELANNGAAGIQAEASAREAAVAAVQAELDSEESRAQSAEAALSAAISSEAAARAAAVTVEASAREAADFAEQSARMAADSAIAAALDAEIAARAADVANESAARIAAISAETVARQTEGSALRAEIEAEAARANIAESSLQNDLSAEIVRAQTAEADLQSLLSAETFERQNAISAEMLARSAADSGLQNNIDAVAMSLAQELLDRTSGDASVLASAQAYADQKIVDLINAAPVALDTLKEIADAIANDANIAATLTASIAATQAEVDAEEARAAAAEASLASNIANHEARLDVMDIIDATANAVVYENNSAVYADARPAIQDPAYREGWYFKNAGPVNSAQNKINWYFFDGMAENISLGDFSGYAILTMDSLTSKPHLAVYTVPGASGNAASWYRSRKVFIIDPTAAVVAGKKYLMYFGSDPKIHPELPRLQMVVAGSPTAPVGPLAADERILTAVVGSDSGTAVGNCECLIEAVGVYSTNIKRKTSLKIRKASVAEQLAASASVASALSVEKTRAVAAEAALAASVASESDARSVALSAEASFRASADLALSARLDIIEGSGAGSIGKAEADAKAYADQKISDLVNSAPAVLNTLKELSDALGGDQNFAATVAGQIGDVQANVDAEEARAIAVEASLQASVAILQGALDSEVIARAAADDLIQASIATEASNRAQEVADEMTARQAADAVIAADLADEVARATNAEDDLDAKIDQEIFDRSEAITSEQQSRQSADNALQSSITLEASNRSAEDAVLNTKIVDINLNLNTQIISLFENNAAVYADALAGTQDPSNRDGWYFKNAAQGQKINWYFFDGSKENISLGDFSAYAVVTFDSVVSKPFLAVYTTPTASGNAASWYKSRVVYVADSSAVVGVKYLMHFGQDPKVHPELPRLSMSPSSSSNGTRDASERILTAALGSDSGTSANNCQFVAESVGIYSPAVKRKSKLEIRKSSKIDLNAEITSRTAGDAQAVQTAKSYTDAQIAALNYVSSVNGLAGAVSLGSDQITEGSQNLYFTEMRAKSAAVVNNMSGSQSDLAPSVSAVKTYAAQYMKKGSAIWCLAGGEYPTLQAAIDAASPGQVILLGEGTWGDATLKGRVDIIGLGAARNTSIVVGKLSFAPTSGSAVDNQVFISNVLISASSTASGVSLGGTAPVRLNLSGCYVYRGSGTSSLVSLTNTDTSATSVRMDGCIINSGGTDGTLVTTNVRFLRITNSDLYGASRALVVNGGLAQVAFSGMETNSATEIIQIATGATCAVSSSLIRNLTTNGSGVSVATNGAFVASTLAMFDVASGTGYCVRGTGTMIYDMISFNHIAVLQPRNIKLQNTLSVVQLPSTPTLVP